MAFVAITEGGLGSPQNTGNVSSLQGLAGALREQKRMEQRDRVLTFDQEMRGAANTRAETAQTMSMRLDEEKLASMKFSAANTKFEAMEKWNLNQARSAQALAASRVARK